MVITEFYLVSSFSKLGGNKKKEKYISITITQQKDYKQKKC